MEITRLKEENYDELISLLNEVFSNHNGRESDFEKSLPKMCVRDDEHMQKHFGIFDGERLVAAVGVYPLPMTVAGEKLLFSTVGNVATRPEYEGRGYMTALLERAMKELDDIGADASRLGGLRHRYNRFGYETCGMRYSVAFSALNRKNRFPGVGENVSFRKIERADTELLKAARELQQGDIVAVERREENRFFDVYTSMIAWQNIPYAAFSGGKMIGYICVNSRGDTIAEHYAVSTDATAEMICAWQKKYGGTVYFHLFPYDMENVRLFSARAESVAVKSPSLFKIISWEKVIGAFMRLKASYTRMADGELKIEIKGYGMLRLYVSGDSIGCEKTEGEADIKLDSLEASRFLFGTLPPEATADTDGISRGWLPLPLSWNGQDRV